MPILKKSADIADADINIGTPLLLTLFSVEKFYGYPYQNIVGTIYLVISKQMSFYCLLLHECYSFFTEEIMVGNFAGKYMRASKWVFKIRYLC